MNELKVFEIAGLGSVRAIEKDGEPWFVAADVCRALEIGTPAKAIERLDGDEKGMSSIHTPGGKQEMTIVNEPGLYSLVRGNGRQVFIFLRRNAQRFWDTQNLKRPCRCTARGPNWTVPRTEEYRKRISSLKAIFTG